MSARSFVLSCGCGRSFIIHTDRPPDAVPIVTCPSCRVVMGNENLFFLKAHPPLRAKQEAKTTPRVQFKIGGKLR